MVEEITATLVVRFGEVTQSNSANGVIVMEVAEIDGKTTFFASDEIPFNVYTSQRVENLRIFESLGRARSGGGGSKVVTQIITFANSDTANLQFPTTSGITTRWLGTRRGSLTLENGKTLRAASKITGVAEVTYTAHFKRYILGGLPGEVGGSANYTVVVAAVGEVRT